MYHFILILYVLRSLFSVYTEILTPKSSPFPVKPNAFFDPT